MTLNGKPAGIASIVCLLCDCDTFKLLGDAPRGAKVGDRLTGQFALKVAECTDCGEYVNITNTQAG